MKITKRPFGTLADGTAVSCWTMENAHGLRAELLDYGATIRSVQVPDRAGRLIDVVLGYDDLAGYTGNPSFYGAIKTDEPRTLDFSGVRGFLVTNVCIVQRSAA